MAVSTVACWHPSTCTAAKMSPFSDSAMHRLKKAAQAMRTKNQPGFVTSCHSQNSNLIYNNASISELHDRSIIIQKYATIFHLLCNLRKQWHDSGHAMNEPSVPSRLSRLTYAWVCRALPMRMSVWLGGSGAWVDIIICSTHLRECKTICSTSGV